MSHHGDFLLMQFIFAPVGTRDPLFLSEQRVHRKSLSPTRLLRAWLLRALGTLVRIQAVTLQRAEPPPALPPPPHTHLSVSF